MPLQYPTNWTAIENAVYDWVVNSTGLDTFWSSQDTATHSRPYVMLKATSPLKAIGRDERRQNFDPQATRGREVSYSLCGIRELNINAQFFTASDSPGLNAQQYASVAQAALSLEDYRAPLRAVGVAPAIVGDVIDLDAITNGQWESRASLDITFNAAFQISGGDVGGYVTSATINGTKIGPPPG